MSGAAADVHVDTCSIQINCCESKTEESKMEYLNLLLYRISVVSFIFIFAFGCGDSDKPTAKASRSINTDTEIVVGVTLMTTSNPFFVILGEAAKK